MGNHYRVFKALQEAVSPPPAEHVAGMLKLSRAELTILNPIIKAVAHSNRHTWDRLKYEIFTAGNQHPDHYPIVGDYRRLAAKSIASLDSTKRHALIQLWREKRPYYASHSDERIISLYEDAIVERLVRRAEVAGREGTWS